MIRRFQRRRLALARPTFPPQEHGRSAAHSMPIGRNNDALNHLQLIRFHRAAFVTHYSGLIAPRPAVKSTAFAIYRQLLELTVVSDRRR